VSTPREIATLAREILAELTAALEAGENLRRERRGIGLRLRSLLTQTDSATGSVRQARLKVLSAIGRTEIQDQIRRGCSCHTGAEGAVEFPDDTDCEILADGLRRLVELADDNDG
jgi:hypothetical protein